MGERMQLVLRPEVEHDEVEAGNVGEVERPLSVWERVANVDWVRRLGILVLLAAGWEAYGRYLGNPLMLPTFTDVMLALWEAITIGPLLERIYITLKVLVIGYASGIGIAAAFTAFAVSTRFGTDLLSTLTAMFNPLPAIALLPLALLWFGLGTPSLVFVIVHSVLWAVALNTHTGFLAVPETMRMAGQNYGLRGIRFVMHVLMPAALPAILAGMKIGWAFAWRTLIAAELVFGVSTSSGGLGWFIFANRNDLQTANVFAGLTAVIIIGLFVESVIFRNIELRTVRRWGMQR
jgi:NitT/TauT family transport system permease protein